MANDIQKLYSLPDISFVSDVAPDFDAVLQRLVSDYEARYEEETGKKVVLRPGDKEYIELTVYAAEFFQMYQQIDFSAKMNLLKYSKGDYLKHLGAFKKTFVQEPKAGETYGDIDCTCQTAGTVGNDYTPGQLEIIVDPVPYVATVSNITKTDGGAGEETEESFRERIYLAPSSYSTAGPSDAYEYWVKQYNSAAIEDVKIHEPTDAIVDIRILLNGGGLPSKAFCDGVLAFLKENPIIPLTDNDKVAAPDVVKYDLKATYYIARSDINNLDSIKENVEAAKDTYLNWQKTKIGRDINPDALTEFVRAAGGKRVVITSPVFQRIPETSVAIDNTIEFVYGGVEDD